MEIKGLDYNTQREKLQMPEYGREIQKMVDHAVGLPTKEERTVCAQTIIRLMETKMPQLRGNADYEQTLWDHLYLMSDKRLDIDWPYDVSEAEKIHTRPEPLPLPQNKIRQRHYGKLIEELFEQLKQMPEGPERDELARQTANQMKRDLAQWGHGTLDDQKVADDIARMTDGVIQLDISRLSLPRVSKTVDTPKRSNKKKNK